MELIPIVIALLVGAAGGAAGYRYWLKRDPEALEALAAKIKAAGQ